MNQFSIHYRKIKPFHQDGLSTKYEYSSEEDQHNEYNPYHLTNIQNYNPLYSRFFSLNDTNYNSIALNSRFYISGGSVHEDGKPLTETENMPMFIKFSPIMNPLHYMIGKYESDTDKLRVLPTIHNKAECLDKVADANNASYIDAFFCYLSSQILHTHGLKNGIDYFGSYLAIQRRFKCNITDDLDYLYGSPKFMANIGKQFTISNELFNAYSSFGSRGNKKPLVFEDAGNSDEFDLGIECIETTECEEPLSPQQNITTDPLQSNEVVGLTVSDAIDIRVSRDSVSGSDSGSEDGRNMDLNYSSDEENEQDEDDGKDEGEEKGDDDSDAPTEYTEVFSDEDEEQDEEEEEQTFAYINDFPTQLICLEKCEGTLDQMFQDDDIDEERGLACLMQVIMALLAYQRAFHLTHNDLHTNNIMYVSTEEKYVYYKFNNTIYRVPTYGKIYKIIDFGRSIYKYNGQIFCSDSFAKGGDAYSQYNTEPFFNASKPRCDPNYSFDLCRLACSIYDFIIGEPTDPRDKLQETIYRWCQDDNGKNVLYKRSGEERYPDFRLYKMIARNVHRHTPKAQLDHAEFKQYEWSQNKPNKYNIVDIDAMPDYS